jgi:hypothetical protein
MTAAAYGQLTRVYHKHTGHPFPEHVEPATTR